MKNSSGSYYDIFILSLPENSKYIRQALERHAQKIYVTPQQEKTFKFHFVDSASFNDVIEQRNIVIISDLNRGDFTSKLANKMLSEEARKDIDSGRSYLFIQDDMWAKNQKVAIFAAENLELLIAYIELYGAQLAESIDESITDRLSLGLFSNMYRSEEKLLEKQIEEEYSYHVGVPIDFVIENGDVENNFLWLRHLQPEQWVFIYKELIDTSDISNREWFANKRDSLCKLYYEGDVVDSIVELVSDVEIDSIKGYRYTGLWRNDNTTVGGPFIAYVLEDSKYRYILDGAVFAPGARKEPYLRQVHTTLRSFYRSEIN
jgi:hypothetical protein